LRSIDNSRIGSLTPTPKPYEHHRTFFSSANLRISMCNARYIASRNTWICIANHNTASHNANSSISNPRFRNNASYNATPNALIVGFAWRLRQLVSLEPDLQRQ
jgi:hypothetical protein